MRTVADILCPVRISSFPKNKPPWLSKELVELSRVDRALKLARASRLDQDKQYASFIWNRCNVAFKLAKRKYILENLTEFADNPKKFWQYIREIMPKGQSHQILKLVDDQSNQSIPYDQTAQYINDFFSQVGPSLANAIINTHMPSNPVCEQNDNHVSDRCTPPTPDKCPLNLMSLESLIKEINQICTYKPSGIADISSRILEDFALLKPDLLLYIMNFSITFGVFPSAWKHALVTPIPKVPNANRMEDLRPISLLPIPGKILERHVYTTVTNFLEINKLFSKFQNGFRKNHGTVDTVFKFLMKITENLNTKVPTISLFIDFKKAFDTISHTLLLKKLPNLYLYDGIISWITHYLRHRSQSTFANGVASDINYLTYGVPQGSIIGPLLFLIYVNDMPKLSLHSDILLYADVTVLTCSGKSLNALNVLIQHDINLLKNLCDMNKLTINVKKTKIIIFNVKLDEHLTFGPILINNVPLEIVPQYKYLGIQLDQDMNMYAHIDNMYRMASDKLFMFRLNRQYLTEFAAVTIVKTMILPYLDMGNCFLTGVKQKETDRLETLLNTSLRVAYRVNNPVDVSRYDLHCSAKILPLRYRRKYFY